MSELSELTWSRSQLGEALERLAAHSGMGSAPRREASLAAPGDTTREVFDTWVAAAGARLGVELEAIELSYRELEAVVASVAPALWRIQLQQEEERYLAVVRTCASSATLLGPQGSLRTIATRTLRATLAQPLEERWIGKVQQVLDGAAVPARRRKRARTFLLREHLALVELHTCWRMRERVADDRPAARASVLPRAGLAKLICAHMLHYALVLGAWWTLGSLLSSGQFDRAGWCAFALLLFSALPLRGLAGWLEGTIALRLSSTLKQRLLAASFRVDTDRLRSHGAGELLARVLEAEIVEALGLSGAFACLLAVLELGVAAWWMLQAFAGTLLTGLLGAWLCSLAAASVYYLRSREQWSAERMRTTRHLVEQMIGQRTRLVQQLPERFHLAEDSLLDDYIRASKTADRRGARLSAFAARGFLVLGLMALGFQLCFVAAAADALVMSLGSLLLAQRACARLGVGAFALFDAWIAWQNQRLPGTAQHEPVGLPELMASAAAQLREPAPADATLLDLRELSFRHALRTQPVLRSCTLQVRARDRLLLQGESGGGKSTLLALLSGLRTPSSGLLLVNGLDRAALGAQSWRKFIVVAPQFHDNHVFNASFAFNLLMGTRWPANLELSARAEALCRELGLGDLIDRMPDGLQQQLGENGWQLSHGERSRLFIARALMQDAPLSIFDESFAGLDPENTLRALTCVRAHARALLVVAHP